MCPPPHQRGRNCFEHLPELPTPRDITCTPRLVNSICLGPLWTEAPTSPHGHCREQNWQGKHLKRHCLHERENPSGPMGRVYAETRGGKAALPLCSDRIIRSPSFFLFLPHAASTPRTSSSTSRGWSPGCFSWPVPVCQSPVLHVALRRDVPFPFPSWAAHPYPFVTRGQSPPRPAWLSTPSPTDLRAVTAPANAHRCSWPLVYGWLDLLHSPAHALLFEINHI